MLSVDGYVRVSHVGYRSGERFISPVEQRDQIVSWARARPARLLEVWEELDESGGRPDRPLLETAVQRIEQGVSQGLVVSHTDRFGRSLLHGLTMIERIRAAGGAFVSVRDGFDISTDTGRLVLQIMLSMAEWQLERTRTMWDVANRRAVARGTYVGPSPPVGYRKSRAGRLRIVPDTARVVREVFERRARGEVLDSLADYQEANGVVTAWGNPGWHRSTLNNLLQNRAYLGEVHWRRYVNPAAHEAIVDEATWQAAQKPIWHRPSRDASPALLAGLVRCMSCGRLMGKIPRRGVHDYHCYVRSAAGTCPAPAWIGGVPLELCVQDVALDILDRRRRPPDHAVEQAEAKVAAAQRALASYRDSDRVLGLLGEQAYAAGLSTRVEKLRAAALALDSARTHRGAHDLPSSREVESRWPDMSFEERRGVLRQLIECVFVAPGRYHYGERIWICPKGTVLSGLPQAGNRRAHLRAWQPRRGWIPANYRARRPRRWPRARLERELRDFLGDRTEWPRAGKFESAGRARLYRQMELQGGAAYWARRFNLPMPNSRQVHWSDERIREELRGYLKDKDVWPTGYRFDAEGHSSLRNAITSSGGVRRWAAEFGLELSRSQVKWTEDRVRQEIDAVCAARTTFPSNIELRRAGLRGLEFGMERHRGREYWAQRSGLPPSPHAGRRRRPRNSEPREGVA